MERAHMKTQNKRELSYNTSNIIWSNIRKFQYLNKVSDEQLACLLDVSIRTLDNYNTEPQRITLKTIENFLNETGISIDKLLDV